jgi:tetratricopeptide (TPR) repeat protein
VDIGEQEKKVLAALGAASLPPLEMAGQLSTLAGGYFQNEQYDQAEPLFWRSLELVHETLGPIHIRVACCLQDLAELYEVQGQYAKAEHLYECIMAILNDVSEDDAAQAADSLRRIEGFYEARGQQWQMANVRTLRNKFSGVLTA